MTLFVNTMVGFHAEKETPKSSTRKKGLILRENYTNNQHCPDASKEATANAG